MTELPLSTEDDRAFIKRRGVHHLLEQRVIIERAIARLTIKTLLACDYRLSVDNGGDEDENPPSTDAAAVLADMYATDDELLKVWAPGAAKPFGWVRFVYGNAGHEVIADYTLNLDEALQPVNAYCNDIAEIEEL